MKRYPYRDVVTPDVALAVLNRDQGCVAVRLGASPTDCRGRITLDHVRDRAAMGGRRAPSDAAHLVSICHGHHLGSSGWATSHKPELRDYLRKQAERTPDAIRFSVSEDIGSTIQRTYDPTEDIERA